MNFTQIKMKFTLIISSLLATPLPLALPNANPSPLPGAGTFGTGGNWNTLGNLVTNLNNKAVSKGDLSAGEWVWIKTWPYCSGCGFWFYGVLSGNLNDLINAYDYWLGKSIGWNMHEANWGVREQNLPKFQRHFTSAFKELHPLSKKIDSIFAQQYLDIAIEVGKKAGCFRSSATADVNTAPEFMC